jgi:hypothetical protein
MDGRNPGFPSICPAQSPLAELRLGPISATRSDDLYAAFAAAVDCFGGRDDAPAIGASSGKRPTKGTKPTI